MSELFKEEDFYRDNGRPSERLEYCIYFLNEIGDEYDQFALVRNSLYPYIRLTKKRGNQHLPCGLSSCPAPDGWFARLTDEEREKMCPKIVWGFAAVFLAKLRYDEGQKDYVLLKDLKELIWSYYNKYLQLYLRCHDGLKYMNLSKEQKELNFLNEHDALVKSLWEKSKPLKRYSDLYEYARDAEKKYEIFLQERKKVVLNKNIESTSSINDKDIAGRRIISQNGKGSVYIENNLGPITIWDKNCAPKNEAYFNNIANQIIDDIGSARVSIHVAIAWFTNQSIADKLVEKYRQGVDVKVIYYNDHTNSKFGVNIDNIPFKAVRGSRGGIMHNKYCIIDSQIVITGSYNWSDNAENKNDENAVAMYDYANASDYTVEFKKMYGSK